MRCSGLRHIAFAAVLGGCLIGAARAQESGAVAVRVTLDPPEMPYHRVARYVVEVETGLGGDIEVPPAEALFGDLPLEGRGERDADLGEDGQRVVRFTWRLSPIEPGDYPIAPVRVRVGDAAEARAPGLVLRARELTEEERAAAEEFAPNDPPVEAPFPVWLAVATALATVGLAAAAVAFALYRQRRRAAEPERPLAPWERAYARLRALDARKLPESGRVEAFYVELSDILRHYMEDRFHLHAPERTTPEFLAEAADSGALTPDHQAVLDRFLRRCDRVKFARYAASPAEMKADYAEVVRIIDDTVPPPDPEEGREDAA